MKSGKIVSSNLGQLLTIQAYKSLLGCYRNMIVNFWEGDRVVDYGLETVVTVMYSEREIFNTAQPEAEYSIENFEFIVQ